MNYISLRGFRRQCRDDMGVNSGNQCRLGERDLRGVREGNGGWGSFHLSIFWQEVAFTNFDLPIWKTKQGTLKLHCSNSPLSIKITTPASLQSTFIIVIHFSPNDTFKCFQIVTYFHFIFKFVPVVHNFINHSMRL